ncbi:MAG: hypothetical protein MUD12_03365 [Spirochaetes bacterium]|jgi:hypothetical protein|nr:hypothetical protein [Spirochaetota bacterium]
MHATKKFSIIAVLATLITVSVSISGQIPDGKTEHQYELKATKGESEENITISWRSNDCGNYTLYRSAFKNGPYEPLVNTGSTSYTDTTAEQGIKYWYKVKPETGHERYSDMIDSGFRNPPAPKGLTHDEVIDARTKDRPLPPAREEDSQKEQYHLKFLSFFYENYFMCTFIYLVGRIYVYRGELIIYRDFENYHLDRNKVTIYLTKPNIMRVKFTSKRLFRFIKTMDVLNIQEKNLLDRLIRNGIVFCIRRGVCETVLPDKRIRIMPHFEAVGFSTEYFRDYKKWKSNTVMFGSSDKEMDRRIKEAHKKGL